MHEFEIIPTLCDGDHLVYRHVFIGSDDSRWVTEAAGNPHVRGYSAYILEKNGRYYCMENSYVIVFSRECGYKIVVEIPSHHEITSASSADGKSIVIDPDDVADSEFQKWYEALPYLSCEYDDWPPISIEDIIRAADLNT